VILCGQISDQGAVAHTAVSYQAPSFSVGSSSAADTDAMLIRTDQCAVHGEPESACCQKDPVWLTAGKLRSHVAIAPAEVLRPLKLEERVDLNRLSDADVPVIATVIQEFNRLRGTFESVLASPLSVWELLLALWPKCRPQFRQQLITSYGLSTTPDQTTLLGRFTSGSVLLISSVVRALQRFVSGPPSESDAFGSPARSSLPAPQFKLHVYMLDHGTRHALFAHPLEAGMAVSSSQPVDAAQDSKVGDDGATANSQAELHAFHCRHVHQPVSAEPLGGASRSSYVDLQDVETMVPCGLYCRFVIPPPVNVV